MAATTSQEWSVGARTREPMILTNCISKGCNYIWARGGCMILRIVSAKVAIIFGGRGGLMILRIVSAKVAIIFGQGEDA